MRYTRALKIGMEVGDIHPTPNHTEPRVSRVQKTLNMHLKGIEIALNIRFVLH
jgi:hypothetical protein